MEAQEVFDTVVNHLRKQGVKAQRQSEGSTFEDDKFCAYRADGGLSCAAGCLIHDDEYRAWMENTQFRGLLSMKLTPASLKERLLPHINLIADLQTTHDCYEVNQWEGRFKDTAAIHRLVYTPPER